MILCNECGNPLDGGISGCAECGAQPVLGGEVGLQSPRQVLDQTAAASVERAFWESIKNSDDENKSWEEIRNSDDKEVFREYLRVHPDGVFAVIARHKLRKSAGGTEFPEESKVETAQQLRANPSAPLDPIPSPPAGLPFNDFPVARPTASPIWPLQSVRKVNRAGWLIGVAAILIVLIAFMISHRFTTPNATTNNDLKALSLNEKPITTSQPSSTTAHAAGSLKHKLMSDSRSNDEMAFSPDGTIVSIATQDGKVQLWDVELGELKKTLVGHSSAVVAVSFSPDNRTLASGSSDNTLKLWDAQTGELKSTLTDYRWDATRVAFSPDGKLLAYSTADGLRLLEARTLDLRLTLRRTESLSSIAFSPDGELVAGANWQMMDAPKVFVWNTQTGDLKQTLNQIMPTYSIAFSPDGRTLACAGGDQNADKGGVTLWDTQKWKSKTLARGTHIWSIAFSPDSTLLAGSDYSNVKIWNTRTATLRLTIKACTTGGQSSVAFSPSGQTLAHACAEGFVKLWDVGGLK